MRKLLWACALALPILALPAEAKAWGFGYGNYNVDCGANVWFNVYQYGKPQAGPWYLYWPYEAHFQTAAPGVSPYFPPPMTLPPSFVQPPQQQMPYAPQGYRAPAPQQQMPYVPQGYRAPAPMPPAGAQPTGYYYYGR